VKIGKVMENIEALDFSCNESDSERQSPLKHSIHSFHSEENQSSGDEEEEKDMDDRISN
jgi:hypothetical protein